MLYLHQGLAFSEAVLLWKELRAGGLLYPQLVVVTIGNSTNLLAAGGESNINAKETSAREKQAQLTSSRMFAKV